MTIDRAKTIEMAREADCVHVNLDGDRAKAVERLERFAALVRAQVIEECTVAIESAILRLVDPRQTASECLDAIRALKDQPGHSAAADAGASTAPLPEGEPSLLETVQQLRALTPGPTVEANSQHWAGMDGAIAWHLIDRHADNWADIGQMMNEWLAANTARAGEASTWQPFDTAPQDGIVFLAANHDREVWVATYITKNGPPRLAYRTNRLHESKRYRVHEIDGKRLMEELESSESWESNWTYWSRGYTFSPTHWMPLPAAPRCRSADTARPGSNEQAESASPSVLLIRGEK